MFDTKRQFLLNFLEEVIYDQGKITIKKFIPIQTQFNGTERSDEVSRIEFNIVNDTHKSELPRNAKARAYERTSL